MSQINPPKVNLRHSVEPRKHLNLHKQHDVCYFELPQSCFQIIHTVQYTRQFNLRDIEKEYESADRQTFLTSVSVFPKNKTTKYTYTIFVETNNP